jgi:ubiquinone/menaquinone biosynthesis C-methylase UbiE
VNNKSKTVGIFSKSDPKLDGILCANWGSSPYEYFWVSSILDVKKTNVLDLGVGLPSQYKWYEYVISSLSPAYYAGIDIDGRLINEQIKTSSYEITHMNMTQLSYKKNFFDAAYCINTFEHMLYSDLMASIQEISRVLSPNGLLLITLDEQWDKYSTSTSDNMWNLLEQDLIQKKLFNKQSSPLAFCLPNFLDLIKNYFVLYETDAVIDLKNQAIYSKKNPSTFYYKRKNADTTVLMSPPRFNSCVSYALLKKK